MGDSGKERRSRLQKGTKYTGHPIDTIIILVVTVIIFVVALAWRDLSVRIFNDMIDEENDNVIQAQLIYAIIVSIIAIIVIYVLSKI